MHLIVGPRGAGKEDYVISQLGFRPEQMADTVEGAETQPVLRDLQDVVRALLEAGQDADAAVTALVERRPELVILCDEVGAGIVPTDPLDRCWRDTVGRICCAVARRAERVDRVLAGLVARLK